MRDDQQLLQCRPVIQLPATPSSGEEQFQNETLRPILKMQHPLLVRLFAAEIRRRKNVFFALSPADQLVWIADAVRANPRFRSLLLGTVIGHFTLDELFRFERNESEYLRRIVSLIIQRLQSVDLEEFRKT
jgi:hypothetical protein